MVGLVDVSLLSVGGAKKGEVVGLGWGGGVNGWVQGAFEGYGRIR